MRISRHKVSILKSLVGQGGEAEITSSDPDMIPALLNLDLIEHVRGDTYRVTQLGRENSTNTLDY
jgi:uncharacterized protein YjhX (UPF0386 family)